MQNKPAFEDLIEVHAQEIFFYIWRMLSDETETEDCFQETFLRGFRAYPKLDQHANFRAWLYRIATNTAYTYHNKRKKVASRRATLTPNIPHKGPSVHDQVDQRLTLIAVREAVDALPSQQKAALVMRKYQELSYAEIAKALDCRQDAARANVYQAVKKLRDIFSPTQEPLEDNR